MSGPEVNYFQTGDAALTKARICPFCHSSEGLKLNWYQHSYLSGWGRDDADDVRVFERDYWYVKCQKCQARGPESDKLGLDLDTEKRIPWLQKQAVKRWNGER